MRCCIPVALFISVVTLSGCGGPPQPGGSTAPAPGVASPGSGVTPPGGHDALVTDVHTLNVTQGSKFRVKADLRSLAVADYFEGELLKAGWKKKLPKDSTQPGQRKWYTVAPVGFTDGYDAAWVDPKTGRVALLNLSHRSDDPGVQHGEFEIFEKAVAPL